MKSQPKSAEELQAEQRTAWVALVEAAFGLANAVGEGLTDDPLKAAEEAFGGGAVRFAEAHAVIVASLRPPAPPRLRRVTRAQAPSLDDVQRASGAAWAALVQAAFAIKNAVSAAAQGEELQHVEQALAQAAIRHAEARQALMDLLRPPPPPRPRRRR